MHGEHSTTIHPYAAFAGRQTLRALSSCAASPLHVQGRRGRSVSAFIDLPGPCCCSQLGMLVQQTRLRAPTWRSASMLSLHRHDVGPTLYTTPWHVHRLENQQAALRQGRGVSRGEKLGAGPAEAAPAGAVPYATRAKGQGCSQGGRTGHAGRRLFALSRM